MGFGRASVLLNLGDMVEATTVALATLDIDPKFRAMSPRSGISGRQITAHKQFPPRWSLFVPQRGLVVVSWKAWETLIMGPAIHAMASTIRRYKQPTWVPMSATELADMHPDDVTFASDDEQDQQES